MTIDEAIEVARKAKSLMHRDELAWLCELAQIAPDGTGVEIGVYCGASLIAWSLLRAGRGAAIGIDNWSYQNPEVDKFVVKGNEHNGLQVANLKTVCERNLKNAGVAAQLFDGDSIEISKHIPDKLAFVFIDGDHTSPAIDRDIEYWTPKIRRDGIVAFHDYGRRKNGCNVTEAVDAWAAREHWHFMGKIETTAGYRRP